MCPLSAAARRCFTRNFYLPSYLFSFRGLCLADMMSSKICRLWKPGAADLLPRAETGVPVGAQARSQFFGGRNVNGNLRARFLARLRSFSSCAVRVAAFAIVLCNETNKPTNDKQAASSRLLVSNVHGKLCTLRQGAKGEDFSWLSRVHTGA